MKKNTYMHFEEESIVYIWSKFQLDTCMFDYNILLTKFGPGQGYRNFEIQIGPLDRWRHRNMRPTIPNSHEN